MIGNIEEKRSKLKMRHRKLNMNEIPPPKKKNIPVLTSRHLHFERTFLKNMRGFKASFQKKQKAKSFVQTLALALN